MQLATVIDPDGKSLPDLLPKNMIPGIVLQPQPFEVRFILRSKLYHFYDLFILVAYILLSQQILVSLYCLIMVMSNAYAY